MSTPVHPSPTCEVTYLENGIIVTDGQASVAVGFFHPEGIPNLVPMTSMCSYHYNLLNPRQLSRGVWSFNTISLITPSTVPNPNIQAPPKLKDNSPSWWVSTWNRIMAYLTGIMRFDGKLA